MLFSSGIILLALSLVPTTVEGQAVYRHGDGVAFIRDGIMNLVGYSGTVFQVLNYMPVCGTLSSSLTRHSDLSDKCTSAMSSFNTSSVTAGIYDISGVPSTDLPGSGNQLCVCGAFGTSTTTSGVSGANGLLCVWVDGKGFGENWWSLSTETRVASSFQLSAQGKSLPSCKDVDLSSMKAESLATRTVAAVQTSQEPSSPLRSTTIATRSQGPSSEPTGSSNSPSNGGTTSSNSSSSNTWKYAVIGVGSMVVILSLIGIIFCLSRRSRRIKNVTNQGTGIGSQPAGIAYMETVDGSVVGKMPPEKIASIGRWQQSQSGRLFNTVSEREEETLRGSSTGRY
ncbi:hypothetical protein DL98DRAFT_578046 [Cadophora sp. DSE1049]|nr:hypothetical protein DL98DRAFT_578046 [Cadophora sp. DSE1049]